MQEGEILVRLPLLGLLTLFAASSVVQSQTVSRHDTVEAFLRKEMKERHIPGMQVAVVQHGKLVLTRCLRFGGRPALRSCDSKDPLLDCIHDKGFYGCGNHAAR